MPTLLPQQDSIRIRFSRPLLAQLDARTQQWALDPTLSQTQKRMVVMSALLALTIPCSPIDVAAIRR